MKYKTILLTSIFILSFLSLPVLAGASAVPWSAEQYTATARGITATGPPLPVNASWDGVPIGTAISTITSDYMSVNAYSEDLDFYVNASAQFLGTYIASTATPLFQFIYDGYYTSVNPGFISTHYAWLKVNDVTNSTMLYEDYSLLLDSGVNTINVSTIAGHEIEVDFGVFVAASRDFGFQTESATLNYGMAVTPEPISSILFVTGGSLLACRNYLRRKRA